MGQYVREYLLLNNRHLDHNVKHVFASFIFLPGKSRKSFSFSIVKKVQIKKVLCSNFTQQSKSGRSQSNVKDGQTTAFLFEN